MRLLAVLLALCAPVFAVAQSERDIWIGEGADRFVGTLRLPAGDPAPVVLLLHGFTGDRHEMRIHGTSEGIFERTARMLAQAGYASLRIDFRGTGGSTDIFSFADTTFDRQISDAQVALNYLQTSDAVAGDDVYTVGWSQGGLIAAALAGRSGAPRGVALWATPADPMVSYRNVMRAPGLDQGAAAGPDDLVDVTLKWGKRIVLRGAFFDGLETLDPLSEIAAYAGPLFVAQGTRDNAVPPGDAVALLAAHEGPERLWAQDMDHVFNGLRDHLMVDRLIYATVGYFDYAAARVGTE